MPIVLDTGVTRRVGDVAIAKPGIDRRDPVILAGLNSPYNVAAYNAVKVYGSNWQWMRWDNLYDAGGDVWIAPAAIDKLTRNITDANAKKFFFGNLTRGRHSTIKLFMGLDGLRTHIARDIYELDGKQQPLNGDPLPTPGALIGALVTGRLSVSKRGAAEIIAYSRRTGSGVALSAWQTYGQLTVAAGAIVAGAALGGAYSGGGEAASTTVAPTTVSTAVPAADTSGLVTIDTSASAGAIGGTGLSTADLAGGASAVGGAASGAGAVGASAAGTLAPSAGTVGGSVADLAGNLATPHLVSAVGGIVAASAHSTPGHSSSASPGTSPVVKAPPAATTPPAQNKIIQLATLALGALVVFAFS